MRICYRQWPSKQSRKSSKSESLWRSKDEKGTTVWSRVREGCVQELSCENNSPLLKEAKRLTPISMYDQVSFSIISYEDQMWLLSRECLAPALLDDESLALLNKHLSPFSLWMDPEGRSYQGYAVLHGLNQAEIENSLARIKWLEHYVFEHNRELSSFSRQYWESVEKLLAAQEKASGPVEAMQLPQFNSIVREGGADSPDR